MWRRHLTKIVTAVLTFSVIINNGYSDHSVLSDCHVTINVSTWSLHGSCLISSTSDQNECFWIRKQNRKQDVIPSNFSKRTNSDQDTGLSNYMGNCSFNSSMPKEEGEYKYYILNEPESTNLYSFDMVINGTDGADIVDSTLWVEKGVVLGRFTCNASSYFQDVLYIWSVPCQNESIIDKTSECSTSLTDQTTRITCIAINATTSPTVFREGSLEYPEEELPTSVLIGGTMGVFGIVSLSVGITIYLKRQKGAGRRHTADAIGNLNSTSPGVNDLCNLMQEERPGTSNDFSQASDKSTMRRQEWDSGQNTHLKLSTMIEKPVETLVISEGKETPEESANFDSSCPNSHYENIATGNIPKATDAVDFRQRASSKKSQEETWPQSDSDSALYNRLSFFTHRRPLSVETQSESAYNHLDQQ